MNATATPATLETVTATLKAEYSYHLAEYKRDHKEYDNNPNEYDKNFASAFEVAAKTAETCGTLDELKTKMLVSFMGYLKAYKKETCNFYYHHALATEKAARICGANDVEIEAVKAY